MTRIVLISNRVPHGREPQAGGLAVLMEEAFQNQEILWIGWSGVCSDKKDVHLRTQGNTTFLTIDLTKEEWNLYYNGFANTSLWPLLHYRIGLLTFDNDAFAAYSRVNRRFAEIVKRIVRPDDLIWVHDYHLMMLGGYLRELGLGNKTGFFFHTPFPPALTFEVLPKHQHLIHSLLHYDLLGFQSNRDLSSFNQTIQLLGGDVTESMVELSGRNARTGVFAASIDTPAFSKHAARAARLKSTERLRESLAGRKLIIGIDRLDYSKGLPERFAAYRRFLKENQDMRHAISYLQITPRSRNDIRAYSDLRRQLERSAGRINGEFADVDWVPLRYVYKAQSRESLAGYLRLARVGLVTPLRDGMNLVAKEYVAAQDPADPGVLILSRFAGAAETMTSALLVNPFDSEETANALKTAITMPKEERVLRWQQLIHHLQNHTAKDWALMFLDRLAKYGAPKAETPEISAVKGRFVAKKVGSSGGI